MEFHINITNMKFIQQSPNQATTKWTEGTEAKRRYQKTARAEAEQATGEAIVRAALAAFSQTPYDRVTLQGIAEASGVTVQTVIRRFGSKEELFATLVEQEQPRVMANREAAAGAGLTEALAALLHHYEQDGDVILNFVAQEHLFAPVAAVVQGGRAVHRQWVERHCAGMLEGSEGARRERLLLAAIVATDLSTWKLLRRDLGLEPGDVAAVMSELLNALKGGQ